MTTDTELVIKIPDRVHYGIEIGITVNGSNASQIVLDAVKNGTPLEKHDAEVINEVLDKIGAEIIDKSYLSYDNNPRHIIDESWVLEIIDKYKAESEV